MKIVFVAIGVESLAIEILSSFLKKHHHQVGLVFDPKLFDSEALKFKKLSPLFDIKNEIVKQVINQKPDLIGFSVFTLNYQRALEIAGLIKKHNPKIPIIFGGIHPTSVPELVIKEKSVDMVCIGEGENALNELLKNPTASNIKNIWFKRNGRIIKNPLRPLIKNLNLLPFPDKDLFHKIYPGFMKDYYTLSSRGCPFACTYCANNVLRNVYKGLGKPIRRRSPQNIINELIWAKEKFSPKKITFVDDIFVQDIKWLKQFTFLYKKKIKLPYVVLTHPRFVTLEIAKLLAKSGCYFLLFGIQSASEKTRKEILKRFETNHEIEQAALNCHLAKLPFSIDHIFNIPGEGIAEHEFALRFYNSLRPSIINSFWLQYFPKTEIINEAIRLKTLKPSMVSKINQGLTSTSLVVGLGNKDSINPKLLYTNFQFLFMLLPILPRKIIEKLIKKRIYLINFKPPIFINIAIKFFVNLKNKREGVYLDIIKNNSYFMFKNLFLKLKYFLKNGKI